MNGKRKVSVVITTVILILSVLTAAVALTACNGTKKQEEKPTLKMAVMSDLHVMDPSQIDSPDGEAYSDYESSSQKMLSITDAVVKTGVDEIIASDASIVLVSGDLAEDGARITHEAVAAQFKKIEAAGKRVFVINGNHDLNRVGHIFSGDSYTETPGVSPSEFAEIYADFGYSEALTRDTATLSYTAKLDDEYRLIAVDAAFYGTSTDESMTRNSPNMTDALLKWMKNALTACQTDGVTPIVMIHFSITSHLGAAVADFGISSAIINRADEVCEALIAGGAKYVFTGHLHTNDIQTYETKDGARLFDIETGALTNYAMPIRYFSSYKNTVTIETEHLDHVTESYLPTYVSSEDKAAISADFTAYAEDFVTDSMINKVTKKLNGFDITALLGMFGLDKEAEEVKAISSSFYNDGFMRLVNTKLYNKDAASGELTVESVCTKNGVTLPESKYNGTVAEFVIDLLNANYKGDENFTSTSVEITLMKYSIFTAVYVVADLDLFGQIHALKEDIPATDLLPAAEALFNGGELDVVKNNLLSTIVKAINYSGDNLMIKTLITSIKSKNSQEIIDMINNETVKTLAIGMMSSEALKTLVTTLLECINAENGTIDIEAILNATLLSRYSAGMLVDDGAPDNNVTITKATLDYTAVV